MDRTDKNTFMNVLTDFAFKRLFGSKERKCILIRFLNILFEKDGLTVTDVTYHDKEILPHDEDGKVIKYDVYCTSAGEKEHFIVEMQQIYHLLFENRAVFYTAKALATQLKRGDKYSLSPVYSIFLIDFHLPNLQHKAFRDVKLMDVDSHEVFSDIMRMVFVSLQEAKTEWDECVTDYDKVIYLIKNMQYMDKESKAYKSGEYREFFDAADMTSLVAEEMVAYSDSKQRYYDDLAAQEYHFRQGEATGMQKGIKQGLLMTAKKMIAFGQPLDFIHQITGLPYDELTKLCSE